MRLGELIDVLEKHKSTQTVRYSYGGYPEAFVSWRGVYKWLTLIPGQAHMAVGDLLKLAREYLSYSGRTSSHTWTFPL